MEQSLCKLTLVYPPSGEDAIIGLMLASEPPLPGFTTWRADGHGLDFSEASANERVRGRVLRGYLVMVLPRSRLTPLLEEISVKAPIPRLAYWVEPVETFGRLTAVKPSAAVEGSADGRALETAGATSAQPKPVKG